METEAYNTTVDVTTVEATEYSSTIRLDAKSYHIEGEEDEGVREGRKGTTPQVLSQTRG